GIEQKEPRGVAAPPMHSSTMDLALASEGCEPPETFNGSALAANPTDPMRSRSRRERSGTGMAEFLAGDPIIRPPEWDRNCLQPVWEGEGPAQPPTGKRGSGGGPPPPQKTGKLSPRPPPPPPRSPRALTPATPPPR